MNSNFLKFSLITVLFIGFFFSGCGDDKGCTDPTSANYNPDATEDDGSCTTYARDKFFGEYLGVFDCTDPLLSPKLDNDSLMFSVKQPVDNSNVLAIIFGLNIDGIPVDLEGTISASGTQLNIDDTLPNFTIPDFPVDGTSLVADVKGLGFLDISDDGQSVAGELELTITSTDGSLTIIDVCSLVGKKL